MAFHIPMFFTLVGNSCFQSIPIGIGGIHFTIGFRSGKTAPEILKMLRILKNLLMLKGPSIQNHHMAPKIYTNPRFPGYLNPLNPLRLLGLLNPLSLLELLNPLNLLNPR